MPTIGNTATPSFGVLFYGINVQNVGYEGSFAMPAGGGLITNLHGYFDLHNGGPVTCWLCMFDGSGNLLASVAVSVTSGGTNAGGQDWHTAALATPVYVAGGTSLFFGWEVPRANGFYASFYNTGASYAGTQTSPPGNVTGGALTGNGGFGAYADYLPVSAHILRSGAWQSCNGVYVLRSGAWASLQELEIERSSAWGPTQ